MTMKLFGTGCRSKITVKRSTHCWQRGGMARCYNIGGSRSLPNIDVV